MAENEHDLFFALEFVHPQDRLREMAMFRDFYTGRPSEVLGDANVPGVSIMGFPLAATYSV